jgi:hypothetical protein
VSADPHRPIVPGRAPSIAAPPARRYGAAVTVIVGIALIIILVLAAGFAIGGQIWVSLRDKHDGEM